MGLHKDSIIHFRDLGLIDYTQAWEKQEQLFQESLQRKLDIRNGKENAPLPENHLLFCEHPHVYTIGKSGNAGNLLVQEDFLHQIKATYIKTNRGGDITYHGPGQLVAYPIFDLEQLGLSVKEYVHLLEESIIRLLSDYEIIATRMEGATGVWLDAETPRARKICAIGVRASRYITMHGLALNVGTDLKYFSYINPCGFRDKGVTRLLDETKAEINMQKIKEELLDRMKILFLDAA